MPMYLAKPKRHKLIIIILSISLLITTVINVMLSYAYFSDRDSAQSVINIGSISINAAILEDNGVLRFDNDEFTPGSSTTKTLLVSVNENANACYLRMYCVFRVDGNIVPNMVFMDIAASDVSNWTEDTANGYLYFNDYLEYADGERSIPLVFTISDEFGNVDPDNPTVSYLGKPYTITIYVDAIQYANDGGAYWTNPTPPSSWVTLIS